MGFIMGVGYRAFDGRSTQMAGTYECDPPAEMLYKQVMFGKHCGKGMILNYLKEDDFHSDILIMNDADIWCIDIGERAPYEAEGGDTFNFLKPE